MTRRLPVLQPPTAAVSCMPDRLLVVAAVRVYADRVGPVTRAAARAYGIEVRPC